MIGGIGEPFSMSIDDRHAAAIGRVAACWAAFEYVVKMHVCILGNFPIDTGACVIAHLPIHALMDAFEALVNLSNPDKKLSKEIQKFPGATVGLSKRRNRAVHDTWMIGDTTQHHYRLELTATKRLVFQHIREDESQLMRLFEDIRTHISKFFALWKKITDDENVLATLRERYQPPSDLVQPPTSHP